MRRQFSRLIYLCGSPIYCLWFYFQMTFVTSIYDCIHYRIRYGFVKIRSSNPGRKYTMVIKVQNLVKRYGDLLALDHFGRRLRGRGVRTLGPNGWENHGN